jgi:hypothetical protein
MVENKDKNTKDTNIQIKIDFYNPSILSIESDQKSLFNVIEGGGGSGASFVTIVIRELLPMQRVSIRILTNNNALLKSEKVICRSNNLGRFDATAFDVVQ